MYKKLHSILNNFLITAPILLKICVWYIYQMVFEYIFDYITILLKKNVIEKVIKKNTFSRVEISIRQLWKFIFYSKIA